MIGILFHGPQIFDNGWAVRLIDAFPQQRYMLAGTMARTALFDSGLEDVESPGCQSSEGVELLAENCSAIILATHSKSTESGMALGPMIAARVEADVPIIQVETNGMVWAECQGECPAELQQRVESQGFEKTSVEHLPGRVWEENGVQHRRLHAPTAGDRILVNGIYVGTVRSDDVVLSVADGILVRVTNTTVKPHGVEKLERLGPIDLTTAKLVSTAELRSVPAPDTVPIQDALGHGVAFIDHAGNHVYDLALGCAGAVTVGDDTTAIAGDILRRFSIPVLGIIDGDGDGIYPHGGFAPGSVVVMVDSDDDAGLHVQKELFDGGIHTARNFPEVCADAVSLLAERIQERKEY